MYAQKMRYYRAKFISTAKRLAPPGSVHTRLRRNSLGRAPGHLLITHHFSFDHNTEHCILNKSSVNEKGTTPWGFCETFSLNLLLGPLPIGVAADVEKCLQSSGSKRLKDFDYGVVSRGGMMLSSVQFLDITFRETSMKWGDPLHFVAWKVIWEKKAGRSLTEMELGKIQSEWEKMDSYSVIETFKRWDPFYRCSKKGCNSISTPFRICAVHRGRYDGHDPHLRHLSEGRTDPLCWQCQWCKNKG